MTQPMNESNAQVSGMRHKECGGLVDITWFWWPEWGIWETIPVCSVHGGPVADEEVELINDNS
jgi:hypothetical protein